MWCNKFGEHLKSFQEFQRVPISCKNFLPRRGTCGAFYPRVNHVQESSKLGGWGWGSLKILVSPNFLLKRRQFKNILTAKRHRA